MLRIDAGPTQVALQVFLVRRSRGSGRGRCSVGSADERGGDGAAAVAVPQRRQSRVASAYRPALELAERRLCRAPTHGRSDSVRPLCPATPSAGLCSGACRRTDQHLAGIQLRRRGQLVPRLRRPRHIELARPYPRSGLPSQFVGFGLGFLRWYWRGGFRADFVSDDDLEHGPGARRLHQYRLIVFAGHEEYVTSHVYDLIESYRNLGGNLAFLSADNFFYRVSVSGRQHGGTNTLARPRPTGSLAGWSRVRRLGRGAVSESALPGR